MSTQAGVEGVNWYDVGSEAPATWDQSWAWNAAAPVPASRSASRVHPAGGVTVTGSASTSMAASSTSPAATPAGAATVVPSVTVEAERNAGWAAPVVTVTSPDTVRRPEASRLLALRWYVVPAA